MSIRIISSGSIEGRPIERLQLLPNIAQIKEAVDPAQQMIIRNVILKAEVVEQPLRCCLRPHHRSRPPRKSQGKRNHGTTPRSSPTKSTQSAQSRHAQCADECPLLGGKADVDQSLLTALVKALPFTVKNPECARFSHTATQRDCF